MAAFLSEKHMSLTDKLEELFSVWVQGNWNYKLPILWSSVNFLFVRYISFFNR
jgi:hypothetical protein